MEKTALDWSVIENDIRENGFLAETMVHLQGYLRDQFSPSLNLAREINRCAQRLYIKQTSLLQGRKTMDPIALGLQLMPRALSAFQGAIIMIELGMPIEAKSLARNVFETAFWMGYLHTNPEEAVEGIRHETIRGEIGLFRSLLTLDPVLQSDMREATEQQISEMLAHQEALKGAPNTRAIAEAAGYSGYYTHFRHLSGGATHTSLKSIFGYLGRDEKGGFTGHQIGPDEDGIPEALHFAFLGLIVSVDALAKITDYNDPEGLKAIQTLFDQFSAVDPYTAASESASAKEQSAESTPSAH